MYMQEYIMSREIGSVSQNSQAAGRTDYVITYSPEFDELQFLPSIQRCPIPRSSPIGLQALEENL